MTIERAYGRTTAMTTLANRLAAEGKKVVFIVAQQAQVPHFRPLLNQTVQIMSRNAVGLNMERGELRGHIGPVVVDHYAYEVELQSMIERNCELMTQVGSVTRQLQQTQARLNRSAIWLKQMQNAVAKMKRQCAHDDVYHNALKAENKLLREVAGNYRTMVRPSHPVSCECQSVGEALDHALASPNAGEAIR